MNGLIRVMIGRCFHRKKYNTPDDDPNKRDVIFENHISSRQFITSN